MAVTIPFVTQWNGKGIKRAIKEFQSLEGVVAKTGFIFKKLMLPATLAVTGSAIALGKVLYDAAQAAAADQAAQAKLAKQLENVTGATSFGVEMAEAYIAKLESATGVADDELRPALGRLATITGNVQRAQELLSLALDVSAGSGQSLEETTKLLTEVMMGNVGGLKKLGIEYKATNKATKDTQNALLLLRDAFEGQAAVAADTFQGKVQILRTSLGNLQETIGYYVLPYVTRFVDMLNQKIVPAFQLVVSEAGDKGIKGALVALAASFGDRGQQILDAAEAVAKAFVSVGQTFIAVGKPILVVVGNIAAGLTLLFTRSFDKAGEMFAKFETAYKSLDAFKLNVNDVGVAFDALSNDLKRTTYKLALYQAAQRNVNKGILQSETRLSNFGNKLKAAKPPIDDTEKSTSKLAKSMDAVKAQTEAAADALTKKMADALDKAKAKLDEQQGLYDEVKKGVGEAIGGVIDFGDAAEYAAERGGTSFFDALQMQADKAKNFGALVERLLAAGLSRSALMQVVNAGVDSGTYIAQELLKSSENILRANNLVEETEKIADRIGTLAAEKFHAAGVANATAYLKGLQETIDKAEIAIKLAKTPADIKGIDAMFEAGMAAAAKAAGISLETAAKAAGTAAPKIETQNNQPFFPEFYSPAFAASPEGMTTSVVVNTVTAPANLGDIIVDALRDYNRRSGPLQLQIE